MKTVFITAAIIIGVIILLLFIICGFIYNQIIWRKTIKIPEFITNLIAGNNDLPDRYGEDAAKAEALNRRRATAD